MFHCTMAMRLPAFVPPLEAPTTHEESGEIEGHVAHAASPTPTHTYVAPGELQKQNPLGVPESNISPQHIPPIRQPQVIMGWIGSIGGLLGIVSFLDSYGERIVKAIIEAVTTHDTKPSWVVAIQVGLDATGRKHTRQVCSDPGRQTKYYSTPVNSCIFVRSPPGQPGESICIEGLMTDVSYVARELGETFPRSVFGMPGENLSGGMINASCCEKRNSRRTPIGPDRAMVTTSIPGPQACHSWTVVNSQLWVSGQRATRRRTAANKLRM